MIDGWAQGRESFVGGFSKTVCAVGSVPGLFCFSNYLEWGVGIQTHEAVVVHSKDYRVFSR